MGKRYLTIEIYWDDLTEEKKAAIEKEAEERGIDFDNNWDVFPMAVLDLEDEG